MTSFKPSLSVAFWLPLSISLLFSVLVHGQTLPEANIIKDINVGSASSAPNNFITFNGKTYFKATPVAGSLSKIMVTDGTDAGTNVAAFSPVNVSLFSDMVLFNNQIYWLAEKAGSITLWKTVDGNSATLVDTIAVTKADTTYNLNNNFDTQPYVANNNLVLHYVKHYAPFSYDTDLHYYAYSNGLKGGTRNVGLGEKRYVGTVTPSNSSSKFVGNNNIFFVNKVDNFSNGYYTIELKSNFNNNQIAANGYYINQPTPDGKNLVGVGVINDNFIGIINDTLYSITASGQKTLLKTGCADIRLIEQLNNTIYFYINFKDIYKTDGTLAGTVKLPSTSSTVPISVKIKINDTLYVASNNRENTYEVWKIDNSKSDFQRILQITGPKLGISTHVVNNQLFMGNELGTKTTLYKPDFVNQKLKLIGQADRFSQLAAIQSGNLIMVSGDNDQITAVNTNAKGSELRSLNLNPSSSTFPCVNDTTRPVFNTCPTNVITFTKYNLSPFWCYFEPIPRPDASDLCGTVFTDVSAVKGQFLPESEWKNGQPYYQYCTLGYDTVTYTARDLLYNTTKCTFRVNVIAPDPCSSDAIPPTFARCPTDTIINANQPTIVNWTSPAVSDNCGIPSLNVNYASGSSFPVGVTKVIYTATDIANNSAVCSFNVAVTSQSIVKDVCANPAANVVGKSNGIAVTGIKTGAAIIQIFNSSWNSVYNQQVSVDSITIPDLAVGTYNVKVTVLETGGRWPSVCEVTQSNVVVTAATNTCENGTLSFDGVNDFFITNSAGIPANTDFTFEALCKSRATETFCSGAFKRLLTLTLDNSNERLEIGDCSGQLTVYRNTPTASNGLYEISNANTLRNGAWHHVAAVKKSDSLYVYYDGVKVLTIGGVATINSIPRRFIMGSWVQNNSNWDGEIDEVRVWNYAASANQIQTLKQCQMVGNESGLVLYYPFNQGVAGGSNSAELTVIDKTTSGVNATLNQFALSGATSNWIC
jgi:hypothetical protein